MSEIPDIVDFLRELPGFDALDDALLSKCARNIDIEYYRKGDDILTIGTDNRSPVSYTHLTLPTSAVAWWCVLWG